MWLSFVLMSYSCRSALLPSWAVTLCQNWVFVAVQAQKYAALRKPYLINDMVMQDVLLDRRRVYGSLQVPSS
jgi:hypothetical protein